MPNTNATPKTNSTKQSLPTNIATKLLTPGWVILALGGSSYILSETQIIGPTVSILLMAATIFQLNQYRLSKKAGGL